MCKYSPRLRLIAIVLFICPSCPSTAAPSISETSDAQAYAAAAADLDDTRIRINTASRQELASFPFINDDGAEAILDRRRSRHPIRSLEELSALLRWTRGESDLLEPHLDFSLKTPRGAAKSVLRVSSGATSSSDARILTRTYLEKGGLRGAVVTERDPGEKSFADHRAGYLEFRHGNGTDLLMGDFRPAIGLGLVYARQSRSAIESDRASVTRQTRMGTSGTDENGPMRGLAAAYRRRSLKLLLAYAHSKWDAAIEETASLRLSGDHAGETGRSAADQLSEQTRLARIELNTGRNTLGWVWSRSDFSHLLTVDGITGDVHSHLGFDASIRFGGSALFGEGVWNTVDGDAAGHRAHAVAVGWRRTEGPLRLDLRVRTLSPDYVGVRSAPASAYGGGNEWGLTSAVRFRSKRGLTLDAFLDRHGTHRPPPSWSTPRRGTRSRLSLTHRASTRLTLEARVVSIQERSPKRETPERFSRGTRIRAHIKTTRFRFTVWAEQVVGRNPERAIARAAGADLRLTRGRLITDLWAARSHSTGSAARIYGFRPEAWGGRSVIALPADDWAATLRTSVKWAHLKISLVTHVLPTRRFALQAEVAR